MKTTTLPSPTFGLELPTFAGGGGQHRDCPLYERIDWKITRESAILADKSGFDQVWAADHFILGRYDEIFEIWTALSALAGVTEKVGLGILCICNPYRNPAIVAKMGASLDVISGGRFILGMGAGWNQGEYRAYTGQDLPAPRTRIEMLREAIEVIKLMWTETKPSFKGKHYTIEKVACEPKPVQKPRPPIIVGAVGPRMLRLAVETGDGWNIGDDPTLEAYAEKLAIVKAHCAKIGRDPSTFMNTLDTHVIIAKTPSKVEQKIRMLKEARTTDAVGSLQLVPGDILENCIRGTPDQCAEKIKSWMKAGVGQFMHWFLDYPDFESIELFADEVIPRFKK
jgi:probable F420-dependent oxidoreductase